jgi:hypothetical protein
MTEERRGEMKKTVVRAVLVALALAATVAVVSAGGSTPYILFKDDFEGDLSQWVNVSGSGSIVAEDGNHVYERAGGSYVGATIATAGSDTWANYAFNLRLKQLDPAYFNLVFRYTDPTHHYLLENSAYAPKVALFKKLGGGYIELARVEQPTNLNTWYQYRIVLRGPSIRVYVDDVLIIDLTDSSLAAGKVGVGAYSGSIYHFDDVVVTALYGTNWLPPISLPEWTLNDRATLPIKFQLYDLEGTLVSTDLAPVLSATKTGGSPVSLPLTFVTDDPDNPYHYHTNYKPGEIGDYIVRVTVGGMTVGQIGFTVTEPPVANGKGKSH